MEFPGNEERDEIDVEDEADISSKVLLDQRTSELEASPS
jgi:hypothetical protein